MKPTEHKYILERYKTRASRYTCPHCGRAHCFTRYINGETGQHLAEECGKCDHESSCGYHYPPRDYFRDHPKGEEEQKLERPVVKLPPAPPPLYMTMPMEYVTSRMGEDGALVPWLRSKFQVDEMVKAVCGQYLIGTTSAGTYQSQPVIFWYVDADGVVHDGKIMWFKVNGHRDQTRLNWISHRLVSSGRWPANAKTRKCFFGEHLLKARPEAVVCIVESEKSALFCALLYPKYLWLATGGCSQLDADLCKVLKGRRVIFYPDSGQLDKWRKAMEQVSGVEYSFVDYFEKYEPNTDIVDVKLGEAKFPP